MTTNLPFPASGIVNAGGVGRGWVWMVQVQVPSGVSTQTFTVAVNGTTVATLTGAQKYGPIALVGTSTLTISGGQTGQDVQLTGNVFAYSPGPPPPPMQGGLVFNVLDYGADPTGVQDSGPAFNQTVADCQNSGGGTVYALGTFLIDTPVATSKAGPYVHLRGAGEGVTRFVTGPNIPAGGYAIAILSDGGVSDATFDSNGLAPCPLLVGNETQTTVKLKQFARRITATNSSGSWNAVFWDMTQTYMVDELRLEDVTILGPSSTAGDAFSVSYVNTCYVDNLSLRGLSRSPNLFNISNLILDGLFSDGADTTAALVVDAGVASASLANVTVNPSTTARQTDVICNAAVSRWVNLTTLGTSTTLLLNQGGVTPGLIVEMANPDLSNGIAIASQVAEIRVVGGRLYGAGQGSAIYDASGAGSVTGLVAVYGTHMDGYGASLQAFRAANAVTWTNLSVVGGSYTHLSGLIDTAHITVTNPSCRGLQGYNPVGPTTVAIPASGTATTALPYDATFYITQATAASSVAVQGQTLDIPIGGPTAIRVPAGETLTPTYTTAPTWVVMGE